MVSDLSALLLRALRPATTPHDAWSDGELLQRFATRRDEDAFALLLKRHGPMVLGVCRRVLRHEHDMEDVFQATFLALTKQAGSLRSPASVGSWLRGVAFRLALQLRTRAERRNAHQRQAPVRQPADPLEELTLREAQAILDEELARLPEKYRAAVVLCCLAGHSRDEAAQALGCPLATVKARLEEARALLRRRLARRGLTLSAALLLPSMVSAAVPPLLLSSTVRAAVSGSASASVRALAETTLKPVVSSKLTFGATVFLTFGLLAAGAGLMLQKPHPEAKPPAIAQREDRRPTDEAPLPRTDRHGDPLPEGALMRLGTVQRRAVGAKLAITPDGKTIVGVRAGKYLSAWDADTGMLRAKRQLPSHSRHVAELSPGGRWLVTDGLPGDRAGVAVWDVRTGKLVLVQELQMRGPRRVVPVVFSPDGARLAVIDDAEKRKLVRVWDVAAGKEVFAANLPSDKAAAAGVLVFSPDGRRLLASVGGIGMFCWNVASGRLLWHNKQFPSYSTHLTYPTSVAFTRDGKVLLPGEQHWGLDLATGRFVKGLPFGQGQALRPAVTPDGRMLLLYGGHEVQLWDLREGKQLRTLGTIANELTLSPDGKTVVTTDGALQRWDLATGKPLYPDTFGDGHVDEVTQVVFSADGKRLASGSRDGSVRLWEVATGRPLRVWRGHERRPRGHWEWRHSGLNALDLSPDGRFLVSGGDQRLRVWDADTDKEVRTITLPERARGEPAPGILQLQISSDGKEVVVLIGGSAEIDSNRYTGRQMHRLAGWNPTTGKLLHLGAWHVTTATVSAIAPGAKTAFCDAAVIDVASGRELRRLESVPVSDWRYRRSYASSDDGLLMAGQFSRKTEGGGVTHCVRVWEAATGKVVGDVKTQAPVGQVAFHPDSRFVATNSDAVRLWDLATGKAVLVRRMPEKVKAGTDAGSYASCLAFAPDGRRLATGHPDSSILLWEVTLPRRRPERLAAKELGSLWADLKADDAATAWRAVWRLADFPGEAVSLLSETLKPVRPAPDETTRPLVANLESDSFQRRQASMKRLRELRHRAEAALRAALKTKPSAEKKQRIAQLLTLFAEAPSRYPPEELRQLRAVAVLERTGSPKAKRLLQELATGISSAPLTRAAAQARKRLSGLATTR